MHDINSESGTKADIEKRNESYNAYVKNVTPKGSCVAKMSGAACFTWRANPSQEVLFSLSGSSAMCCV